jgi:hypothetical protein
MAIKEDEDGVQVIEGDAEGEVIAVEKPPVDEKPVVEAAGDERMAQGDEDDEPDHPSTTDAEREARRLERRARKEREKAAKERNRRELNFLRSRNEALERRFSGVEQRQVQSEAAIIDDRISTLNGHIQQAESIHAEAITKGNGADAVEANRIRDELRDQRAALLSHKQALVRGYQQQAQQPQQTEEQQEPPAPELLRHASDWQKSNSWYKPDRTDQDSVVAGAIDDRLVAEGFDPETEEYWNELTNRVKKVLPHRFQSRPDNRPSGGPAMANGGRSERSLKPGEVYVSAERKAAMVEAGVWDDPKLRTRYLKQYQKYDSEHGASRA